MTHISISYVKFLTLHSLHSHFPEFTKLENWPTNSLDFNPVDFQHLDLYVQRPKHQSPRACLSDCLGQTSQVQMVQQDS